jgi:serine/threonine-protein kinase
MFESVLGAVCASTDSMPEARRREARSAGSTDPVPSGIFPKAVQLSAGARVGDYVLEECIGRGGMAEVWRARSVNGGPHVAIKRMLPHIASDPRSLDMFQYEAALGLSFQHPNVVKVLSYDEFDGQPFFVMDLVDGLTCTDYARAVRAGAPRMTLPSVLHVGLSILEALQYLHDFGPRGLVHRDVSPGNILCDGAGQVFLADFGIVLLPYLENEVERRQVRGKRGYMAPEQLSGQPCDPRADLFALGVVLSEMLIGGPLFGNRNELVDLVENYSACPKRLEPALSGPIGRVIRTALAHSPLDRFASAREMAIELRAAAKELGVEPNQGEFAAQLSHADHLLRHTAPSSGPRLATPASKFPPPPRRLPPGRLRVASVLAERFELASRAIVTGRGSHTLGNPALEPVSRLQARPEYAPLAEAPQLSPFERAELPAQLFRIAEARRTGLFLLRSEEGERRIYFQNGVPVLVVAPDAGELFGARLVRAGFANREQIRHALERSLRAGEPLGQTLLRSSDLVPIDMLRLLLAQMTDRFVALGTSSSGGFAFLPDLEPVMRAPRPEVSTQALVVRVIRRAFSDTEIDRALYPHLERTLPTAREIDADRFGLTPEERQALTSLREPGALVGRCGARSTNMRAFRVAAFVAVSVAA